MSLLSDSPGTLYLGELLNRNSPMAHAHVVNGDITLAVALHLNQRLPGDKFPTTKKGFHALQRNLGRRVTDDPELTQHEVEKWALTHGFHTLLYKLFGDLPFIERVKMWVRGIKYKMNDFNHILSILKGAMHTFSSLEEEFPASSIFSSRSQTSQF
jgi:hypothetical protein